MKLFRGRPDKSDLTLPIPTHMKSIFLPIGENSEFAAAGIIRCPCGCERLRIYESNDRHIIRIACDRCGEEYLLFDSGRHGWNGFVCGDDWLDRESLPEQFFCPKCRTNVFGITVRISSQGRKDFEENAGNDMPFSSEDWVNAFDWITVSLVCEKCGRTDKKWLDTETM